MTLIPTPIGTGHEFTTVFPEHVRGGDALLEACSAHESSCRAHLFDRTEHEEGTWHVIRIAADGVPAAAGNTDAIIVLDTDGRRHPHFLGKIPVYMLRRPTPSEQLAAALTAEGTPADVDTEYTEGGPETESAFALTDTFAIKFIFNNYPHNGTVVISDRATHRDIFPPLYARSIADAAKVAADLIAAEHAAGAGQ